MITLVRTLRPASTRIMRALITIALSAAALMAPILRPIVAYAREKGLKVINTPEASSQSVAELVFAHFFSGVRDRKSVV